MTFLRLIRFRSIFGNPDAVTSSLKLGAEQCRLAPLEAAALLLSVVVVSHAIAAAIDPRLPAAAVAMSLYLVIFTMMGGPDAGTTQLYRGAAAILPMLFVPIASGVVTFGELQIEVWIIVTLVIVGGTLTTLVTVGLLAQRFLSRKEGETS